MYKDVRDFLQQLDEKGQLRKVDGADAHLEIGTITELVCEREGPALLFDNIKGYPAGYRVVTNIVQNNVVGQKISFGIPEEISEVEAVRWWKDKLAEYKPYPAAKVESGPVMENVLTGKNIDIRKFPAPFWHELDGGRYIGTGSMIVTKDPDEGWINFGTYRVMIQEDDGMIVSFYISPGKQGNVMRHKYWAKGESCPVVMCFGQDPLLFAMAATTFPWGMSEFDVAGYLKGKPIDVIEGPVTGLPIPAAAEIAIEGFSPPPSVKSKPEGPFGEWTGYYASGRREKEPILEIKGIYHRNDPIIHGQPPLKPPVPYAYPISTHSAGAVWARMEAAGMPGLRGVYGHGPGGRAIMVVSIKQGYIGHSKEALFLAAASLSGSMAAKTIIVVDDDIDPANLGEVLWAYSSRCNPEDQIDIVRGHKTSQTDPSLPPHKIARGDISMGRVLIDACRPYYRYNKFAPVNIASDELRSKIAEKYVALLNSF
jgi:UbiD family decarboxylase